MSNQISKEYMPDESEEEDLDEIEDIAAVDSDLEVEE